MLLWIIQITFFSIILIFLVHHLINFLKNTLTVPKIKDLVNSPIQKYENIYSIIKNNSNANLSPSIIPNSLQSSSDYTLIDLLPKEEENINMKNELKKFLKSTFEKDPPLRKIHL